MLKTGGALGAAGLLFAVTEGKSQRITPLAKKAAETPQAPVAEQIRAFERKIGDRALTFEEAQGYIPLLAQHFVDYTQTSTPAAYFSDHTFILRDHKIDKSEADGLRNRNLHPGNVKIIRQLLEDYSGMNLPDEQARRLLRYDNSGIDGDRVFLNLEKLNNAPSSVQLSGAERSDETKTTSIPIFQYGGFARRVECSKPTPVVQFRSAVYTELARLDNNGEKLPIDSLLLSAHFNVEHEYDKKYEIEETYPHIRGIKEHFQATFVDFEGSTGEIPEQYLNEMTAGYLTTKISAASELPYATFLVHPVELYNFAKILDQSGIGDVELYDMYRNSKLEEFLLQVARGATNVILPTDEKKMEFATEMFLYNPAASGGLPPLRWDLMQHYYYGLDTAVSSLHLDPPDRLNFPMYALSSEALPYWRDEATISCANVDKAVPFGRR